jgi:hypothetical protein
MITYEHGTTQKLTEIFEKHVKLCNFGNLKILDALRKHASNSEQNGVKLCDFGNLFDA